MAHFATGCIQKSLSSYLRNYLLCNCKLPSLERIREFEDNTKRAERLSPAPVGLIIEKHQTHMFLSAAIY